jgi:TolA-binding protein
MSLRRTIAISTAAVLTAGTAVVAFSPDQPTEAEGEWPIVQQVEEHEVRITDLEGQAVETQAQVEENTTQIVEVQRVVTNTVTQPAQTSAPTTNNETPTQSQTPAPAPSPEPVPTPPAPEPHPRTVMSFTDVPEPSIPGSHVCKYTLYSALETSRTGSYTQPDSMPCLAVGEVLPR